MRSWTIDCFGLLRRGRLSDSKNLLTELELLFLQEEVRCEDLELMGLEMVMVLLSDHPKVVDDLERTRGLFDLVVWIKEVHVRQPQRPRKIQGLHHHLLILGQVLPTLWTTLQKPKKEKKTRWSS